jgi:addiction module RelB/DinJ family antitoxin
MNTMMSFRIPIELKQQAQSIADSMGIPLSSVLTNTLQEFVRTGSITFSRIDLSPAATKRINASIADALSGEDISRPFTKVSELLQDLRS